MKELIKEIKARNIKTKAWVAEDPNALRKLFKPSGTLGTLLSIKSDKKYIKVIEKQTPVPFSMSFF